MLHLFVGIILSNPCDDDTTTTMNLSKFLLLVGTELVRDLFQKINNNCNIRKH